MYKNFLSLSILASFSLSAFAQNHKTSYAISNQGLQVRTQAHGSSADYAQKLNGFLFDSIVENLKRLPMVSTVEFAPGIETVEILSSGAFDLVKRSFPLKVGVSGKSIELQVVETYRKCKRGSDCALKTTTVIDQNMRFEMGQDVQGGLIYLDTNLGIQKSLENAFIAMADFREEISRGNMLLSMTRAIRAANEQMMRL